MGKVCLKSVYKQDRDLIYSKVMDVLDEFSYLPVVEKTHVLRMCVHKVEEYHGVGVGSGRGLIAKKSRGDGV